MSILTPTLKKKPPIRDPRLSEKPQKIMVIEATTLLNTIL